MNLWSKKEKLVLNWIYKNHEWDRAVQEGKLFKRVCTVVYVTIFFCCRSGTIQSPFCASPSVQQPVSPSASQSVRPSTAIFRNRYGLESWNLVQMMLICLPNFQNSFFFLVKNGNFTNGKCTFLVKITKYVKFRDQ